MYGIGGTTVRAMKVQALVVNGSKKLILSESFLADDAGQAVIGVPTTAGINYRLVLRFLPGEVFFQPESQISGTTTEITVQIKLGTKVGNFIASKHGTDVTIAGKAYTLFFAATRVAGRTVRVEVSLYE